jgi:hypothetical protein
MTIPNAKTQRSRILRLLIDARGEWVPLPEIMACAAQYNARVYELRRLGFDVKNKTETDSATGVRHSWFRLAKSSSAEPAGGKNVRESDFMRRRREEDQQEAPLFTGTRP